MPEDTQKQVREEIKRGRHWGVRIVRPGTEQMIEVTSGGASFVTDTKKFTNLDAFKRTIANVKRLREGSA